MRFTKNQIGFGVSQPSFKIGWMMVYNAYPAIHDIYDLAEIKTGSR
jgi:hypothetical protein